MKVIRQFGIVDSFKVKCQVAQVEFECEMPEWVTHHISTCTEQEIDMALHRSADPLARTFRYTPMQCLDRVPMPDKRCAIYKGCVSWRERLCMNLKKNPCRLYEVGTMPLEMRVALTDLVNLWRDGFYVVVAS